MSATGALTGRSAIEPIEPIDAESIVDRLVFADAASNAESVAALRVAAIAESVEHHMHSCPPYAALARRRRFDSRQIRSAADLDTVPQLPAAAFKRGFVTSVGDPGGGLVRCVSTGTRGQQSVVGRDRRTLQRLLGSIRCGKARMGDWDDERVVIVDLGPPPGEAGGVWFSYLMTLVELEHLTEHVVSAGVFDPAATATRIAGLLDDGLEVVVVGIPPLVATLAEHAAKRRRFGAGASLRVITGGGWKQAEARALAPGDFREVVTDAFGLTADEQVRDTYNQVELNTVLFECAAHRMHLPSWLHVSIRDPRDLVPLEAGCFGLVSYVDPTAVSYPAFVVTDDVGRLDTADCVCGDHRASLHIARRVKRPDQRGCALTLSTRLAISGGS